jgi:hypothetical protein
MRRLVSKKNSYKVGENVRIDSDLEDIFYEISSVDDLNKKCFLIDSNGQIIEGVDFSSIIGENEYLKGDEVIYFKHPYDNKDVFVVEEVLGDGKYFIVNEKTSYTNVNGRSIKLKK